MALRLSTGLRNAVVGKRSTIHAKLAANTISFDSASKEIRDSGNGFVTAGFKAGDKIGAFNTASNNTTFTAVSVTAGVIVVEESVADESAGTIFALAAGRGGAANDLFREGVLAIYSGSQPASADDAESGTLLVLITDNGGAHDSTTGANGLEFEDSPANGQVLKKSTQTWKGTGIASGTAGWFRLYARDHVTGSSPTAMRLDGACATSGAELNMASTAITAGQPMTIDGFPISMPAS